jgi:5-methylcytosine-specific restriction endonuclease McrA
MWSDRGSNMGSRWAAIRQKVLRDSGGVCAKCGEDGACEVDHIVSRRLGGSNEYNNLQALCRNCHARKSSSEGNAAKARLRAARVRPSGRHPGRA